jgi:FkbH-like protein
MLDQPLTSDFLAETRQRLNAGPITLPMLFQVGDAIAEYTASTPGTQTQRIAVIGSATTDYLWRAVACGVAREGVLPVIYQAPFGSLVQEVLDPASGLHGFRPDLVVIAVNWRDLAVDLPPTAPQAEVDAALEAKLALFRTLWERLPAKIIQHLPAPPASGLRGMADRLAPASPANQVRQLNTMLARAGQGRITWVDMEALANGIGARRFMAAKFYYTAKLDHDPKFLPDYLPAFQAAWRSVMARGKKVLVLDLDNTLWGGVIGDDGPDGIKLGADSPAGEAFLAWQHTIKALSERGVILAVCSKNDPAVAETGLSHPSSALRRADFAAFVCSWDDKATGLRRIATELNVSLDSFVFCDDNPAECELVRQQVPEVSVICMGTDPAAFIDLFEAGHWFDMDSFTQEDLGRAAAYAARAAAQAGAAEATDVGAYLRGLEMKGRLYRPDDADIARVAQLELKTNQFNTTTRRFTEPQIRAFLARKDAVVLAFRLSDKFGDHGLTSTVVAVAEGDSLRIESWLMSCRIFSRTAEAFILRGLLDEAARLGLRRVVGLYEPTARNGVVADLFARLGFAASGDGSFSRDLAVGTDDLQTQILG